MKKVIGILGMVALATGVFFSNNVKADQNLDIASLVAVNSANAECISNEPLNSGGCATLSQMCFWGRPGSACDPWAPGS